MEKLFDFQFLFDVKKDDFESLHVAFVGTTVLSSSEVLDLCKEDAFATFGNQTNIVSFNYNVHNEQKKD